MLIEAGDKEGTNFEQEYPKADPKIWGILHSIFKINPDERARPSQLLQDYFGDDEDYKVLIDSQGQEFEFEKNEKLTVQELKELILKEAGSFK